MHSLFNRWCKFWSMKLNMINLHCIGYLDVLDIFKAYDIFGKYYINCVLRLDVVCDQFIKQEAMAFGILVSTNNLCLIFYTLIIFSQKFINSPLYSTIEDFVNVWLKSIYLLVIKVYVWNSINNPFQWDHVSSMPLKLSSITLYLFFMLLIQPWALKEVWSRHILVHMHTCLYLYMLEEALHDEDLLCDAPYVDSYGCHPSIKACNGSWNFDRTFFLQLKVLVTLPH